MKNIRVGKYDDHHDALYTRSVRVPEKILVQMILSALGVSGALGFLAWSINTWPDEQPLLIGITSIVGVIAALPLAILLAMNICETIERKFRNLTKRKLLDPCLVPPGFKSRFIDTPEYQRVLAEWMEGNDIDPLYPLNDLLEEKIKFEQKLLMKTHKSEIVKTEVESLKAYLGKDK